jgi:hypothetical protein
VELPTLRGGGWRVWIVEVHFTITQQVPLPSLYNKKL